MDRDHMADLRTITMGSVETIARGFKEPDADFVPAFIYIDGGGAPVIVGIDNSSREGDEERVKNQVARFLEAALRRDRALAAALMMSVWIASAPPDTPAELIDRMKASRRPDRREVLWLQVTDGHAYEVWQADLIRHSGAPPTVGDWSPVEGVVKESRGRFVLWHIFRRALGIRDETHTA